MIQDISRLNKAAVEAIAAGDMKAAQAILLEALQGDRSSIRLWLSLAAVRRQLNDFEGAFAAVREVLQLDNRNFPALLMQAAMLDHTGQAVAAAYAYGIALVQAPPDDRLDAPTRQAVTRARAVHQRYIEDLGRFIRDRAAPDRDKCTVGARRRIESFIDTTLRVRKRYQQEPMEYYYPGLPAIEFYERDEFPWLAEFESKTAGVQADLGRVLVEDEAQFSPYIQYDDHLPLDQWRELNKSPRWSAFHFYRQGRLNAERAARAPRTIDAIRLLPQAEVDLRSPTAMYSVLQPHTRIPPHHGVANFRLVVHLPLVLPPACGFRVGGETREWRIGEAWVFDDTIEHTAWNESDQTRIILICDIWSPRLAPDERAAIRSVIAATDAFNGTVPAAHI